MSDFTEAPLPVRNDLQGSFRHLWHRLAAPGTWWTGIERTAIAHVARAAYEATSPVAISSIPEPASVAAALLGKTPAAVTEELIDAWEQQGLDANHYVELVAIVAMVTAVDTFYRAMGLDLEPLPSPLPGEPSRTVPHPPAIKTKAWVPMVGPPTIPSSLSAVPAELEALESLHGPMYLSYEEMGDPAIQKGLSRAQMELVAGRTSAFNECFF
ncbi:MAG: hypothetical protein GY788_05000 [bacterium]|nr:hypothetical protein [bacterium]